MPRDFADEERRLAEGKPVAIRTEDLTQAELDAIMNAPLPSEARRLNLLMERTNKNGGPT